MMGKVSNKDALEVIPLNQSVKKSKEIDKHKEMERLPYMSDPQLVPRVQKYLESNVEQTYVDINVMADELQRSYREYARLKRNPFRNSVKKAYAIVLQSYGLEGRDNSSSEDEDSDDNSASGDQEPIRGNQMNKQIVDLYSRPSAPKQIDENELIDISSDDSDVAENVTNNDKNKNGPSTSLQTKTPHVTIQKLTNSSALKKALVRNDINKSRKRKSEVAGLSQISFPQQKRKKSAATIKEPSVTLKDVGGLDKTMIDVVKLMIHIRHKEAYTTLNISPPRGLLLHGPPGCGKTLLAHAIAGEMGVPLLQVSAPELVGGISGESEERIRDLFERAVCSSPCVLFIDEIDAIAQTRQHAQKKMEERIVSQLLTCLVELGQTENGSRVVVIAASNRPDDLDPALRREGRFDREIRIGIPDLHTRTEILKVLTSKHPLAEDVNLEHLAKATPGFVGADLKQLTTEAAMEAVNRLLDAHKDRLKFEAAVAAQKAAAEKKNKKVDLDNSDQNKSDQEIIVDDEVPTKSAANDSDGSAIVVIDDDSKQVSDSIPAAVTAPQSSTTNLNVNGDNKLEEIAEEPIEEPELMPVDVVKQTTALEDWLWWYHNCPPLTKDELSLLKVTMDDYNKVLKTVQPSVKREGFTTVPDVTWDDIGSLNDVRRELQLSILAPVRHPELAKKMNFTAASGVLLCGPPGCGKTLLAKAIANEAGINFLSVKGPELLNMYLGESERAVRLCFERARNAAPCVIFFDELDALCPKRGGSKEEGTSNRVVNQMLTEMDGVESRQDVFILAASNRPDIIDPAILRPGRLDKTVFVGLPTASDRVEILRAITKNGTKPALAPDVDLESIGNSIECRNYTGADLSSLVKEAVKCAFEEAVLCGEPVLINNEHFKRAITKVRPSVPEKDLKHYEKLRKLYADVPEQEVEEMEYS